MYQLNYISTAMADFTTTDLNQVLQKAVISNSTNGITGCLIHHNSNFVQILEGSKENVISLYNKIKKDSKHYDLKILWQGEVEKRCFEEWSMVYHHPNTESIKQYVNNLLLLSEFSEKPTATVLTFWLAVKEVLD